jgi:lipid A disaccharide synthetase
LDKLEFVFSVGEASGDRVASALFLELKASAPNGLNIHGSGICGQNMSDAGIASIVDCRNWGSIGVIEALRLYPQ